MHPNEALLHELFRCLNQHNPALMADCYCDPKATFSDIAFTLENKKQIHAMWDIACSTNSAGQPSDIRATVKEISADDKNGRALVVVEYTFRDTNRKVVNEITSVFTFERGKIKSQVDDCDEVAWAKKAIGGIKGFFAGHVSFIRRRMAMNKLKRERPLAFKD